jgi:hypothetical protein
MPLLDEISFVPAPGSAKKVLFLLENTLPRLRARRRSIGGSKHQHSGSEFKIADLIPARVPRLQAQHGT